MALFRFRNTQAATGPAERPGTKRWSLQTTAGVVGLVVPSTGKCHLPEKESFMLDSQPQGWRSQEATEFLGQYTFCWDDRWTAVGGPPLTQHAQELDKE